MQVIINGVPTEYVDPRLEVLEKFLVEIRALVGRHEQLASGEDSHYWDLLDELHHFVRQVPQVVSE